jgi:4-azaleucine resistance transporter AzlC
MTSPSSSSFIAGLRAELPILIGVAPFGMIYGVLALEAGIPALAAQAMSAIVFAGSSQFVFAQLVHLAAPPLVILPTVAIVNLRHALYSASVAPYLRGLRPAWKWLLAYLLTDEAFAVAIIHYEDENAEDYHKHWYFFGAGLALWSTWQLSTAAGIFLGAVVPSSWSLDFTLALTFIALVIPALKDRPGIAAALSAGITALLAFSLPYKLGLVLAALVGVGMGLLFESWGARNDPNLSNNPTESARS